MSNVIDLKLRLVDVLIKALFYFAEELVSSAYGMSNTLVLADRFDIWLRLVGENFWIWVVFLLLFDN